MLKHSPRAVNIVFRSTGLMPPGLWFQSDLEVTLTLGCFALRRIAGEPFFAQFNNKIQVPAVRKFGMCSRATRLRMPSLLTILLTALEANLILTTLALISYGYPNSARYPLWEEGEIQHFNSNPKLRICFFANHLEPPEIPYIWSQSLFYVSCIWKTVAYEGFDYLLSKFRNETKQHFPTALSSEFKEENESDDGFSGADGLLMRTWEEV
ncbi:hypothetical protein VTL71DRAFT_15161 [Oculimacula yallundae]|uniref:Uncharacterized protein n=1 Tax=Oculimacula yallundae TaxID=86028 RepID=A0ABR4CFT1_9HELO